MADPDVRLVDGAEAGEWDWLDEHDDRIASIGPKALRVIWRGLSHAEVARLTRLGSQEGTVEAGAIAVTGLKGHGLRMGDRGVDVAAELASLPYSARVSLGNYIATESMATEPRPT